MFRYMVRVEDCQNGCFMPVRDRCSFLLAELPDPGSDLPDPNSALSDPGSGLPDPG